MVSFPLLNLWDKRSTILHFALMNAKTRYLGTYMGFLWSALEPLFAFIILYTVFTTLRGPDGDPNFPIYLLVGIMFFQIFSRGTLNGLASLRVNAVIIKSLNIRREIFPVVSAGTTAILMIVHVAVLFFLMPFFGFTPPWTMILLPFPLILMLLLVLGLSYLFSVIFVYIRDLQPAWSLFSYALFFISPIFWYLHEVSGILKEIHFFNPLGRIIEIAHNVVFNEIPPYEEWLIGTGYVLVIFFVGYYVFQKFERNVAEEL